MPFVLSAATFQTFMMMVTIFAIVTLHEFGHILASKRYGIKCETVVLSCIGGAAFLDKEPETPWSELVVALCGPLVNVLLMLIGIMVVSFVPRDLWVTFMFVNAFMVTFNMLPALPMDGGRVFRAVLWFVMGRRAATLVAVATSFSLCIVGLEHAWVVGSLQLGLICGFIGLMAAGSLVENKDDEGISDSVDGPGDELAMHLDAPAKRNADNGQSVVATVVPTKSIQGNPEAA